MKNVLMTMFVIGSLCACAPSFAGTTDKVNAAVKAAEQWLQLVDQKNYSGSWDEAARFFKAAVKREIWIAQLNQYRAPLGEVVSRKVLTASYMTSLPNAPKGEYVVIQFQVKFASGKKMVETITPLWDEDNAWRVSGYYIK